MRRVEKTHGFRINRRTYEVLLPGNLNCNNLDDLITKTLGYETEKVFDPSFFSRHLWCSHSLCRLSLAKFRNCR